MPFNLAGLSLGFAVANRTRVPGPGSIRMFVPFKLRNIPAEDRNWVIITNLAPAVPRNLISSFDSMSFFVPFLVSVCAVNPLN